MTSERYQKSLQSGLLQLTALQKITHYGIVLFFLAFPTLLVIFHILDFLKNIQTDYRDGEILFVTIPTVLAVLFYWLQTNRLKLTIAKTNLTREEIMKIVKEVEKELGWIPYFRDNNIFIAKTIPGFFSGSWGEQITIFFDDDQILINSICDLDSKPSVVSMGRNRKNIRVFLERLNQNSVYTP